MSTTSLTPAPLLNRAAYVVRTRFDSQLGVDTYQIEDPGTGLKLGFGRETWPGPAGRLVRGVFGRNLLLTTVQVYERDAQTLAFTLRERPSLWLPRLVLSDAQTHELCYFRGIFATIGGGFLILDREGQRIGRVEIETHEGYYALFGRTDQRIGTIEQRSAGPGASDEYAVSITDARDCGRIASLLLLGTAIAADIVYRDRVGSDEPKIKGGPARGGAAAVTRSH